MSGTFPNVPVAPGVPPLPRDPNPTPFQILGKVELLVADAAIIARMFLNKFNWGIFNKNGGGSAINSDSVISVDVRADANVATAPQEMGSFINYDKVMTPRIIRMTLGVDGASFLPINIPGIGSQSFGPFSIGDPMQNRKTFISTIEDLRQSVTLLDVMTPENLWQNMTVMHYEWRRTANEGATLLKVDVWLQEVRQSGTAQYTKDTVGEPVAADPVNTGKAQATSPTSATGGAAGHDIGDMTAPLGPMITPGVTIF